MIDWNFEPIFGSFWAVIGLVLLLVIAVFAIRQDRTLEFRKRAWLFFLRLLTVLVLLLAMLRPGLTLTRTGQTAQSVAVLVDTSLSMQLPSGSGNRTRWELEKAALASLKSQHEQLGKDVKWQIFTYDTSMRKLAAGQDDASFSLTEPPSEDAAWNSLPKLPEGPVTDVAKPLADILTAQTDPPLLGIVWMGDATQTVRNEVADAQQASRNFAQLDIPLFLIGIGPRSGSSDTRDQAVEGVPDQLEAFTKNTVAIRGTLRAIGLQNQSLKIKVFQVEQNQEPKLLAQSVAQAKQNDQSLPFQIPITAPDPGAYQLLVRAEPIEGEATLLNNEMNTFLNVRDSGSRVLYIEGEPRQEQKFIRTGLADSPDIQIDFLWIPQSSKKKWPVNLGDRLRSEIYDCIILGDVDSDVFGKEGIEQIVKMVEEGTGLITLGGYHAYASGGYDQTSLAKILPIQLPNNVRQEFEKEVNGAGHIVGELPVIPRDQHPVTQLNASDDGTGEASAEENAMLWTKLRPLLGINRWGELQQRPGVQVIAETTGNTPLIVSGDAGRGRVLSIAFDTSYRWWRSGQSALHRKFWRQSVLWTMRREDTEEGIRIEMPRRSLSLGESVDYNVIWNPGSKNMPIPKDLTVRWYLDGADQGPLVPTPESNNRLKGNLNAIAKPGRYELVARAKNANGDRIETKLPFIVVDLALEKIQASPDWQLMNQLAKLNESAGGKVVAPEATQEIIDALNIRRKNASVDIVQTYRLGDGAVDSWLAFVLITFLLTVQWGFRKAWNLP